MMDMWLPNSGNSELYKAKFKGMDNGEFEAMMASFRDGEDTLRATVPNFEKARVTVEGNLKVAAKLGHNFLERLWLTSDKTGITYLTPQSYLTVKLPLRRQSQLLFKKMRIPKNNNTVDSLTGQATGESKGSSITAPEAQILNSLGLTSTLEELMKVRGGDATSHDAFNKMIYETGTGDVESATSLGGTVKVNDTFGSYLNGLHISNTIPKQQ